MKSKDGKSNIPLVKLGLVVVGFVVCWSRARVDLELGLAELCGALVWSESISYTSEYNRQNDVFSQFLQN